MMDDCLLDYIMYMWWVRIHVWILIMMNQLLCVCLHDQLFNGSGDPSEPDVK